MSTNIRLGIIYKVILTISCIKHLNTIRSKPIQFHKLEAISTILVVFKPIGNISGKMAGREAMIFLICYFARALQI